MYKQKYIDDCNGCKRSQKKGEPPPGKIIIPLNGDWVLNHFGGGFLGWLALQTRFHRMDLSELCSQETNALGRNIQLIDKALRNYWSKNYPDDPIERVYIVYFFESAFHPSEHWHLHMHLIPRTKQLGRFKSGYGKPWEVAAWNIANLPNQYWFPPEYQIRKKDSLEIDEEKINALMKYLESQLHVK